jgi:hypothetical protein
MKKMTSKEKKDIILRDVIKPELKRAGYTIKDRIYKSERDDCSVLISISSGRFNSEALGFSFSLCISALKGEWTKENLWRCWFSDSIHENLLLPDDGFLHPYHDVSGYKIDGFKNYKPQNMDLEDIKNRITDDLHQYILPPLAEIKHYEDWLQKSAVWKERVNTKRVCLLRFYHMAQMTATITSKYMSILLDIHGLSVRDIKENCALYQQIRALSYWPDDDKWELILAALPNDEIKKE